MPIKSTIVSRVGRVVTAAIVLSTAGIMAFSGGTVAAHGDHESHSGPYVNNPEPTTTAEAALSAETWWAHVKAARFADETAEREAAVEAPAPEPEAPAPAPVEEVVVPPTIPAAVEAASCANDKRFAQGTAQNGWGSMAEYCAAIEIAKSYEAQFFGNIPNRFVNSHPGGSWEEMRYQQMFFTPTYKSATEVTLVASEHVVWLNHANPMSSPDAQFWYRPEEFLSDIAGLGGCRSSNDIRLEEGSSWYANCYLSQIGASILVQASSNSVDIRFHWTVPR